MDDEFWEHLLHKGAELIDAGDQHDAIQTLEQVAASGHPDASPKAASLLGKLFSDRGNTESARGLLEYAVASEHPTAAPQAALRLGRLLAEEQEILSAQHAYALAAVSEAVGVSTTAKVAIEQMREAFDRAVETLPAAHADYERGRRFHAIDDLPNASAAFRRTIVSQDPQYAPQAAIALAGVLTQEAAADAGDSMDAADVAGGGGAEGARDAGQDLWEEVRSLLRHAATSGHPEHGPAAAGMLADLLEDEEDQAGAVEMLQIATTAGDPSVANPATARLAELLVSMERFLDAAERFLALTRTASVETGAHAALRIGVLFGQLTSDTETTMACLRYAADHGREEIATEASNLLAEVAERSGAPVPAEPVTLEAMQQAVSAALARSAEDESEQESENDVPVISPADPAELRAWAERAPAEEVEEFCERTMSAGYRLDERDELLQAVRAWEQVMATGEPRWAARAAARIAVGLWTPQDDTNPVSRAAGSAITRLADLGHPHLVPRAWLVYAKRMVMGSLYDQAEHALRLAVDSACPGHAGGGDADDGHAGGERAGAGRTGAGRTGAEPDADSSDTRNAVAMAAECELRILQDDRDAIMPALRRIGSDDLVHEVLDFAYELAAVRKREAAASFRTVHAMATFAGDQALAEQAEADQQALTD